MKKLLFIMFLAAAIGAAWVSGIMWRASPVHAAPPGEQPAVPVTVASVKQADFPVYLRGLGTVEALNTVEIKAQVNGELISLPVKEGQEVKPGDTVAVINPAPYKAALDQAIAQRAEDEAQLRSAQLDLARYENLAKKGYSPQQQVDDEQATVNKLAAAVQADSAAIEAARINLTFCIIRSPISGRASLYQTDVGNIVEVATQTGIVSIMQDKPIAVVFTLPESDLPRLQDAMEKGKLPVAAYTSDDTIKLGTGSLLTPNNTIDTATGTIQVKAIFPNDNERLWPGQFVHARVLVEALDKVPTVPLAAIEHGPDGLFVYTVQSNDTVKVQPVKVNYQDENIAVVSKGLQPGQTVVVGGQSRLTNGARVAVGQARAPPRVGAGGRKES
jgi:membrane fusion protein, multidrug efflux system